MTKRKRHILKMQEIAAPTLSLIASKGAQFVQPHLVAIYDGSKDEPYQVATGTLIARNERPVLLTAKHSLFGEAGNGDLMTKSIFVEGELKLVKELVSHDLMVDPNNDLIAFYVDEFSPERCFPLTCLCRERETPALVTIFGYLARDFRRDRHSGILRPSPYIYTNKACNRGSGYVGLLHPKSLNRVTLSGKEVMAPRPSGLSGCPMMNSIKLIGGKPPALAGLLDRRSR